MAQYLYAKDSDDSLIDIAKITPVNRNKKYYCPSCGMEMTPVLGEIKEHHFRHKGDSCSYESYLHKISKLLLKWRFDHSDTFEITYYVDNDCNKTDCWLRDKDCNPNKTSLIRINLKDLYNLCEIEGTYNGFRADIKLSNTDNPHEYPLFLEVAVSHKCTPEKISSDVPIIEIQVTNERDVLQPIIEQLHPTEAKIKFYNFNRSHPRRKQLYRFLVYRAEHGYIEGATKPIGSCGTEIPPYENTLFEIQSENAHYIWCFGMFLAAKNGLNIKDCGICNRYRDCNIPTFGERYDWRTKKRIKGYFPVPISTLIKDKQLNPTIQANRCPRFTPDNRLYEWIQKQMKDLKYRISKPFTPDSKD